jgi:enoyl-CoA hydratase/carnithine racemase
MVGDIEVKTEKGIPILTINRVNKKNALCEDMYSIFADAFEQLGRDETIRCMLIKANGDTFCAGNDISFFLGNYSMVPNAPVGRFLNGLVRLTKPWLIPFKGGATLLFREITESRMPVEKVLEPVAVKRSLLTGIITPERLFGKL